MQVIQASQAETGRSISDAAQRRQRPFDGIICFGGEDWWYHNRGHFDMQMMRHLSRCVPVLYVNSIGMRVPRPREGRIFLTRISRKLRSLRRGHVRIRSGFSVLSPFVLPGRATLPLTKGVLTRIVRTAARRERIRQPLVWVACPTAAEVVETLQPAAVVYQRTDRYEAFHGVDIDRITTYDAWLKARADLTLFCSRALYEQEADLCEHAAYLDHGVDYDRFVQATFNTDALPPDLRAIDRPRIGFIGGIDQHTFDPELFCEVARLRPEMRFVLVGACSLPQGWCDRPNVFALGQRSYESVPAYMAGCDVLIMPWRRGDWIDACNPVKLKEYLAVGRPIVSTPFPELQQYRPLVRIAEDAAAFASALDAALAEPFDVRPGRDFVRRTTWRHRADTVLKTLHRLHIGPRLRWPPLAPMRQLELLAQPEAPAPWLPDKIEDVSCRRARDTFHREPPSSSDHSGRCAEQAGRPKSRTASRRDGRTRESAQPRLDVAACLLLAGGLKPSPLTAAAGRSVLDLSLTPRQSVLDVWLHHVEHLLPALGRTPAIRIVHDAMNPPPWPGTRVGPTVSVERDPKPFRGPGGLVRDLCAAYGDDQHIILAEAGRYLPHPLTEMLAVHTERRADVTVGSNPDGTPSGIYLVRCGTLALVPDTGFTDLKEQWLSRVVDAGLRVMVHHFPRPGALPLRTLEQFLAAARTANRAEDSPEANTRSGDDPGRENETIPLRVICENAFIGPGACVIDSVVMPGASVGPEAVIVRSLVCPDTRIQAGTDIADAVISAGTQLSDDPALCTQMMDPA